MVEKLILEKIREKYTVKQLEDMYLIMDTKKKFRGKYIINIDYYGYIGFKIDEKYGFMELGMVLATKNFEYVKFKRFSHIGMIFVNIKYEKDIPDALKVNIERGIKLDNYDRLEFLQDYIRSSITEKYGLGDIKFINGISGLKLQFSDEKKDFKISLVTESEIRPEDVEKVLFERNNEKFIELINLAKQMKQKYKELLNEALVMRGI